MKAAEKKPEEPKKQEEDAHSDRSDNAFGLVELLTDTDYKKIEFTHKGFTQPVYALQSASTDFDLTGQVIWQAADIMSAWFIEDKDTILASFKDKRVLELGAGPGLCGLVAATEASSVIFTDHMDLVMDLIDKNMVDCNPRPQECKMYASCLDWEKIDQENYLENLDYTNAEQQIEGKFSELQYDIIIGSDVVYWPQAIMPLCTVLTKLFDMQKNKDLVFYICYIERIKQVHQKLLETFGEMGFVVEEVAKHVTKEIN